MLIPLIAAGTIALATWLLYQLLKKNKKSSERKGFMSSGAKAKDNESGRGNYEDEQSRRKALIDVIVKSVEFAAKEMVTNKRMKGLRSRKSLVPNSNYNVRPIGNLNEFVSLLPQGHLMDDDHFYAKLASKKLMVGEFVEYYGKAKNTLIAALDASGSMEHYRRYEWAVGLVDRLIQRSIDLDAEIFLVVFTDYIRNVYHAHDKKTAEELRKNLPKILVPNGGTNINLALSKVFEIVAEGNFTEARVLLVTDGTEGVDEKMIAKEIEENNIFLHTVCIAGERKDLKKISNKYDRLGMFS